LSRRSHPDCRATGDPTEKLDAMEAIVPPHLRRGRFQPTDKLIALLKSAA
jgi:integrase/recombinase XerD